MVQVKKPKPHIVEIWEWKNRNTFIKSATGKVIGGIVTFPDADPVEPVIWLGDPSYIMDNQKTKRSILFYDTITKMLFKPSELGKNMAETGVLPATVKNVIMGGQDARQAIGLQDNINNAYKWTAAIVFVVALVAIIFLYLMVSHNAPAAASTAPPSTLIHIPLNNSG